MSQVQDLPAPSISLYQGRPATTSLEIARFFGKRHDHVLRDVDALLSQLPENSLQPNFGETSQEQETPIGIKRIRIYMIQRDGFMLLVMGYTGKKALALKLAYIEAFNRMEAELSAKSRALTDDMVLPTPADAPITPADQNILQSIVKAKVEAIPEDRRSRGVYPQIWGRFNNHFRLSSYRQLPQCRMAEAVAYLTRLPVRESLPAPAESLDAHLAAIRTHIGGIHAHQTAIFTLGRKALPPRPSRPGGPAPALWGASVLSLYGLEKSCAALDACLENLEMMARAVVSVAHA